MRLYKNNSGVTLVELVISMAIAAIVLSMLALIISTASKSFRRTNEDVNLQMEAQITMNQLNTYIMEASSITGAAIGVDGDFRYSLTYKSTGNPDSYYVIYLAAIDKKLYLVSTDSPDSIVQATVAGKEDDYLMAEHVSQIEIDNSEPKTAKVLLKLELGDQTYTATKNIKLRNVK